MVMKQILVMMAAVLGQSVAANDNLIADAIVEKAVRIELKKPEGELAEKDLKKVTFLSLTATRITNQGLKEVAKLEKLKVLWLRYEQITDAGLKEVAKLQQLEQLYLFHTKITDAGLKELAKLQNLKYLHLTETKITDAGLKEVTKLKNLTSLDLRGTQITDEGLKEVAKLQKLEKLSLWDTKATKAGVAELKKALPKCRIRPPLFYPVELLERIGKPPKGLVRCFSRCAFNHTLNAGYPQVVFCLRAA